MYPNEDECAALPYHLATPDHLAYDLVYLPEETMFLKHFREHGAKTKNGLEMLHAQAEKAWSIFGQ